MADKTKRETIGIILLNLGGPDSIRAVKPFLYNLFSDRQIIQLGPSFLQKPIAWLISTIRSKKTERYYRLIGGKSPIFEITKAQAKALEDSLNIDSPPPQADHHFTHSPEFKVFVAMRYWYPLIEEVIPEMYKDGIKKLIVLSLYPQYSIATTGSSLRKFKKVLFEIYHTKENDCREKKDISSFTIHCSLFTIHCITSWFNHPVYVEVLVDVIKKGLESFNSDSPIHPPELIWRASPFTDSPIHVLFSAHSLPQKFIKEGDPYVREIMGTIEEIIKRISIRWHLSYQSKSGPVKWLEPSTDEKLKELAGMGIKNVLVVPISFVSDHIETLYEIDILYKQMAGKLGINLRRTESLNTHPLFIEALKGIVLENTKELGWLK